MPVQYRGDGPTRQRPARAIGESRAPSAPTPERWPSRHRTPDWEPDDFHQALREPRRGRRRVPAAPRRIEAPELNRRSRRREPWDPGWGERAYLPSPAPSSRWRFFILALALTILALGAALTAVHFLTGGTPPGETAVVSAPHAHPAAPVSPPTPLC